MLGPSGLIVELSLCSIIFMVGPMGSLNDAVVPELFAENAAEQSDHQTKFRCDPFVGLFECENKCVNELEVISEEVDQT